MRRVYFVGFRGFPRVQGGIETHVENLVLRLSKQDLAIFCFGRERYVREQPTGGNFKWIWLWAPKQKGLETFIHTCLCVFFLAFMRRGVVHLHGIGPGAFSPVLRLLRFRVIVTHHGYDYARAKWGPFAAWVLKAGEFFSVRYSHAIISVSRHVATELSARFNRQVHYIPNGMPRIETIDKTSEAQRRKTTSQFFLVASRFVAEKRIQDAIRAFSQLKGSCASLIIAGSAENPECEYLKLLYQTVPIGADVIFLGSVSHDVLWTLMRDCLAFINASSHEGLPISVLEAGAHGAPLILSDIPAHREFALPDGAYYAVGDAEALAQRMKMVLEADNETARWRIKGEKMQEYSWDTITESTISFYC